MIKNPMMLLVGDREIDNTQIISRQIDGIKKAGFDAICLEFRRCRYNELNEEGQQIIKFCYEYAKKSELKFVKIIPHYLLEQLEKYPFLKNRLTKKIETTVRNGKCLKKNFDQFGSSPSNIVAAFRIRRKNGNADFEKVSLPPNIPFNTVYDFISTLSDGRYVFYFGYETNTADYASPKSEQIAKDFLEILKDYQIDGFALDEFGAGSRLKDAYTVSPSFLEKFYRKYGYRFEDRLYLMDYRTKDYGFARLRYYV